MNDKISYVITLGGGCFWCVEAVLQPLKGVISLLSGYADGETEDPNYEQICTGTTGHAEVVQVTYDPQVLPLEKLLDVFFMHHNPTTLNRQGADRGTQYRSIILTDNDEQLAQVESFVQQLEQSSYFSEKIVTQVKPMSIFYPAEDYHQNYFILNPQSGYCQVVINPKLAKLKHSYLSLLK